MSYQIGEYVVRPGHGVAQVCDIESKDLGGETKDYYILKTISNGMRVFVPTDSEFGIRALIESEEAESVYSVLNDHNIEIDTSTWNRRNREYTQKIKTGSLIEIAEVLRALFLLKDKKSLSAGEKNMLSECRELLSQEISLSSGEEKSLIDKKIDNCFEGPESTEELNAKSENRADSENPIISSEASKGSEQTSNL